MEIRALNENGDLINEVALPYINLQWQPAYYKHGKFSVQILAKHYHPEMYYIYNPEREVLARIESVDYKQSGTVKTAQITGQFVESILDDKITWPLYTATGNLESDIYIMVDRYKDDLPIYSSATSLLNDIPATWQSKGEAIGSLIYSLLQQEGKSYIIKYDYVLNQFNFEIYKGVDRLESNPGVNFVTFSTGFRNLKEVDATLDKSVYKNYFVIEGAENIVEILDLTLPGETKRQFYIDATNESWERESTTEIQYRQILQQIGLENALEYGTIKNIRVSSQASENDYLTDYNVGDKVTVQIEDLGLELEVRIVAAYEVVKGGQHTIELEFGDYKATIFKRERLKR